MSLLPILCKGNTHHFASLAPGTRCDCGARALTSCNGGADVTVHVVPDVRDGEAAAMGDGRKET